MRRIREWVQSSVGAGVILAAVTAALVLLNTDLMSPPRFDGAGYAVLGDALATGRGYREIDRPEAPRHAHFPPGYPAALALIWRCAGRSVAAAHLFSVFCTVAAVLLDWWWFREIYPPRVAFTLGLALAVNWSWGRSGGSIQSEPFYVLWEFLAVLLAVRASRRDEVGTGILLGFALAACALIRHIGLCFAAAVLVDLGLRGHWRALRPALLVSGALIFPWVGWLALVQHNTQVGLLAQKNLAARIPGQAVFYFQRLPDQITGPIVEVGTVFRHSAPIAVLANLWAAAATGIIIWGWIVTLRTPRRRLGGLIALLTLALLLVWPFTEAGRFLYPIVPFLLVGAIEGLGRMLAIAGIRRCRDWACGIILALSIPYAAYAIASARAQAQQLTHADFDAACQWIAENATSPGLVLTRHPGEVFWATGRQAIAPESSDLEAIDQLIDRLGVAYLLIDEDRYANADASPLSQYVERYPNRVRLVWDNSRGDASIQILEVIRHR